VTTQHELDERRRLERARQVALFRYSLVQEIISPQLTPAQRGLRVRQLAAMAHDGPDGPVRVSLQTVNRWKRDYLAGGFEALVPSPRQSPARSAGDLMVLAAALKRENPERTAAQVARILATQPGAAGRVPSDRTLQRLFARLELNRLPAGPGQQQVFGRFEATRPNELWTGDALHGPAVGGRKAYLSVTWNHRGMAPRVRRGRAIASPQADGDGGPAGDGCGTGRQVAGSGAARAGC
jgi:putative transposase